MKKNIKKILLFNKKWCKLMSKILKVSNVLEVKTNFVGSNGLYTDNAI